MLVEGRGLLGTALSTTAFAGGWLAVTDATKALLFTALVLLHEAGHLIAARRERVASGPIVLLPFVGGYVRMRSQPSDVSAEARIGLAGPLVGGLAAIALMGIAKLSGSDDLWSAAAFGLLLNAVNLAPLSPFDGGRVVGGVHPLGWAFGGGALVALTVWHPFGLLFGLLVAAELGVFGLPHTWRRLRQWIDDVPGAEAYYGIGRRHRLGMAAAYASTLGALCAAIGWAGIFA
jgi:Zn-dependent protease